MEVNKENKLIKIALLLSIVALLYILLTSCNRALDECAVCAVEINNYTINLRNRSNTFYGVDMDIISQFKIPNNTIEVNKITEPIDNQEAIDTSDILRPMVLDEDTKLLRVVELV